MFSAKLWHAPVLLFSVELVILHSVFQVPLLCGSLPCLALRGRRVAFQVCCMTLSCGWGPVPQHTALAQSWHTYVLAAPRPSSTGCSNHSCSFSRFFLSPSASTSTSTFSTCQTSASPSRRGCSPWWHFVQAHSQATSRAEKRYSSKSSPRKPRYWTAWLCWQWSGFPYPSHKQISHLRYLYGCSSWHHSHSSQHSSSKNCGNAFVNVVPNVRRGSTVTLASPPACWTWRTWQISPQASLQRWTHPMMK